MENDASNTIYTGFAIISGKHSIFNENGELITSLYREREGTKSFPLPEEKFHKDVKNINKKSFYAGLKPNHFGHFLLESLSRLSGYDNEHYIIWHGGGSFNSWQKQILEIIGLDDKKHIFIDEPTSFDHLKVVKPNYVIWDRFTEGHCKFLGKAQSGHFSPKKKAWLSRSRLVDISGWENEAEIERYLARSGWDIIHPEELSVQEQSMLYSEYGLISGIEGSAFHTLILSQEVKSEVIIFIKGKKLNGNYKKIAETKKINQKSIKVKCIDGIKNNPQRVIVSHKEILQHLNITIETDGVYELIKNERLTHNTANDT